MGGGGSNETARRQQNWLPNEKQPLPHKSEPQIKHWFGVPMCRPVCYGDKRGHYRRDIMFRSSAQATLAKRKG